MIAPALQIISTVTATLKVAGSPVRNVLFSFTVVLPCDYHADCLSPIVAMPGKRLIKTKQHLFTSTHFLPSFPNFHVEQHLVLGICDGECCVMRACDCCLRLGEFWLSAIVLAAADAQLLYLSSIPEPSFLDNSIAEGALPPFFTNF